MRRSPCSTGHNLEKLTFSILGTARRGRISHGSSQEREQTLANNHQLRSRQKIDVSCERTQDFGTARLGRPQRRHGNAPACHPMQDTGAATRGWDPHNVASKHKERSFQSPSAKLRGMSMRQLPPKITKSGKEPSTNKNSPRARRKLQKKKNRPNT